MLFAVSYAVPDSENPAPLPTSSPIWNVYKPPYNPIADADSASSDSDSNSSDSRSGSDSSADVSSPSVSSDEVGTTTDSSEDESEEPKRGKGSGEGHVHLGSARVADNDGESELSDMSPESEEGVEELEKQDPEKNGKCSFIHLFSLWTCLEQPLIQTPVLRAITWIQASTSCSTICWTLGQAG